VKNAGVSRCGRVRFRDIGDYLTREEKLSVVSGFGSVEGITAASGWKEIVPDAHGDWVRQRDEGFDRFIALGSKEKSDASPRVFETFSLGVATARDAWAYNPSKRALQEQIAGMIAFYNDELTRFDASFANKDKKAREAAVEGFINTDASKISWTRALKNDLAKSTRLKFEQGRAVPSLYRPFMKQWLYFDRKLNDMVYQVPRLFPRVGAENRVIMVKQRWSGIGHLALMIDSIPDLQSDGGAQCFPRWIYSGDGAADDGESSQTGLFAAPNGAARGGRQDGITDAGLTHFAAPYPSESITKDDVFYYVYGVLHSEEYRSRFVDNLGKELPRIPRVKTAADFWAFSKAGRALGELHVGYESVQEYPATIDGSAKPTAAQLRVEKMKFGKGKDKTTIHYNEAITVRDIPLEAYDYVVNGKPAIEWVIERQSVSTDKESGIVKDANAWATETAKDLRYPLSLLLRVITVSLETMKIVRSLPALDLGDAAS
jgi:predicted helicase